MPGPDDFRILIAGGGVAGLTLANALEQAGVDYVLLERRDDVAPQVGASIGVFPNAARIFDQLGAWERIQEAGEELRVFYMRDSKGNLITAPDRSSLLVHARTGYWTSWGERQNLLRILYENLKDPSKVLVNKELVDVSHDTSGITVLCSDGSSYRGDLLVGADGVFSKTRSKMWDLAAPEKPDVVRADKECLISEYNCLFGIARGVENPKIAPGDVLTSYNQGRCVMVIMAEGGKAYFFAQERLPGTCRLDSIPRYTDEDARAFVVRNEDLVLLPEPDGFTLGDLWKKTQSFRLVAIEEAKFKLWHWGRIVCAGDSIHKSTPNLGIGGNSAVESAAALANGIKKLADACAASGRRPSQQDIEHMLDEYQKKRQLRAEAVVDASGLLARAQNIHGLANRLFVKYMLPQLTDFFPELMGNAMIGATKLDFLPLPMASLTGTKPFNPTQGDGLRESKLKRMLFALPLLALSITAAFVLDPGPAIEWAERLRDGGSFDLHPGSVPILRTFTRISSFDDFLALLNMFFLPSIYGTDMASRRQLISFLTDGVVLLTIWIMESVRRANTLTVLEWPSLFALAGQLLGIGVVGPFCCLLHYVLSPVENFSALDQRLTDARWSRASLPAVALAYLLPFYLAAGWPIDRAPLARQALLFLWQLYPLWMSLLLRGLAGLGENTMPEDKVRRPLRDLPVLNRYVGAASALAAGVWWWAWLAGGLDFHQFVPAALPRDAAALGEFTALFLRWDEVFGLGAHLVWLAYLFGDLARAGMLREGWVRVVGLGVLSLLAVGPGATLGLGWLWREHILVTRKHKDALTPESVGRLHGIPS